MSASFDAPIERSVAVGRERDAAAELRVRPLAPLVGTNFVPSWLHVDPERVKTHAAPPTVVLLSSGPPIRAVLPSDERATAVPN